jgi:inner membrane protein
MPTILSHPAFPIALSLALGRKIVSARLLAVSVVASILPDADVIGFKLSVAYSHQLGHRGFSHSVLFAILVGSLACVFAPQLKAQRLTAFMIVAFATASHGLLDMCTNGGLGIAYLWPQSEQRYFLPFRPILVSPLDLGRFFGPAGQAVLLSELKWVWLPLLSIGIPGVLYRHFSKRSHS